MDEIIQLFQRVDQAIVAGDVGGALGYSILLPRMGAQIDGYTVAVWKMVGALADDPGESLAYVRYAASRNAVWAELARLRGIE